MKAAAAFGCSRLVLVRHGETVGNSTIRYYGRTDVALSDLGHRQMLATAPTSLNGSATPLITAALIRSLPAL